MAPWAEEYEPDAAERYAREQLIELASQIAGRAEEMIGWLEERPALGDGGVLESVINIENSAGAIFLRTRQNGGD